MRCFYIICISIILMCGVQAAPIDVTYHADHTVTINGIYGRMDVRDPVLCDIIRSPELQRLQGVHQYGPFHYVVEPAPYTRWEHSLGVFMLTAMYGGSYYEQIAALLHDVSHTVFSHAGGWMHYSDYYDADRHQDDIHGWFLEHSSLVSLLGQYGIDINEIHHKNDEFPVLEQELPDICADRLDYNLQGAYYEGMMRQSDINTILSSLHFRDGVWFFDDVDAARLFAANSIYMSRNIWGSSVNGITNYILGSILRYAVDHNILSTYDVHFATDDDVWSIIRTSSDDTIAHLFYMLSRYQALFFIDSNRYDIWVRAKFRGIDPYVVVHSHMDRLSTYDAEFATLFQATQDELTYGWPVRCLYKEKEL